MNGINLVQFLLIGILSSCIFTYDPPPSYVDSRMTLTNSSPQRIYYLLLDKDSLDKNHEISLYWTYSRKVNGTEFTDTVFSKSVDAGNRDTLHLFDKKWGEEIESYQDKKLRIFLFEREILESYSWDEIVADQIYSKRMIYSVNDLEKLDWRLVYP